MWWQKRDSLPNSLASPPDSNSAHRFHSSHFVVPSKLRNEISLGAELILAGAYFYELKEVVNVIRSIAEKLRPPIAGEPRPIEASPWGVFSLRKVDVSWAKTLMLGVFDYYKVKTIDAYQIIPDEAHWTIEIPDLSQPWSPESAPAWRWSFEPWTYPIPRDSVALTNLDALRGGQITEVIAGRKTNGRFSQVPAQIRRRLKGVLRNIRGFARASHCIQRSVL
jgi:hypothetical protein